MPKKGTRSKKDKEVDNMPDWQENKLPDYLEVQRTRVVCNADAPIHVYIYMLLSFHVFASVAYDHLYIFILFKENLIGYLQYIEYTQGFQYSGAFATMGVDNSVSVDKFCKNFKIDIKRLTEDDMEFDMIGVDASIANAFRRILIAEVPTMAIEKIFMADNTSVIADEVLSHRLGLIPLDADPRLFYYISENDVPNERNTIVYKLHVSCEKGSQRITVKLMCIHAIELEAHAIKGIGKVHAKWSPVATAWYRMLPEVVFLKQIEGDEAEELVKKCPVNVFDIEDLGNGILSFPFLKCLHYCVFIIALNFHSNVLIRGVGYCFSLLVTIESTGALPPEVLFTEAVKILEEKCEKVISELS
ncbi:hypothetical protein HU200_034522 [Digitaria exilis]|uniref:DNA-directed RNA polymerase RpoA/D/Rpb3-type domain-containing protein n=1 Tax=Digitaria exilis TaxID=1010633 RepID=A0A835BJ90_9POAL|nr:hypothetical protein HU200_034522 [Digitaria exilis]